MCKVVLPLKDTQFSNYYTIALGEKKQYSRVMCEASREKRNWGKFYRRNYIEFEY